VLMRGGYTDHLDGGDRRRGGIGRGVFHHITR
jgi:hypothetical protein